MRRFLLVAVKLAVSALLLYFSVRRIDLSTVGERLNRLEPGWVAAGMAIVLVQVVLVALRWRQIALLCGAPLSAQQSIRFNLIASFFSQVLPSTVGGDAARVWLLARSGAGWTRATYSVLLDRFIGVLALATCVAAGLYWSFGLIADPIARLVLVVIGFGFLLGGLAFLALGRWSVLTRWKLTRNFAELSVLGGRLLSSSGSTGIVLMSLLIHALTAVLAWSVAQSIGAKIGVGDAFLLVLPVMLIATIPVSIAGWGVRESALVMAFSYAGLPAADGLVVSVLLGGVMFAAGLIGGAVWLINFDRPDIAMAWRSPAPPAEQS
jgi:uncharacterized membrane protein YbhN (UPF0104 family)